MAAVPQARTRPRAGLMTLLIAYSGFILLGLVDGVVGVAWPSMQATFGVALDAMGLFLLPGTLAYTVVSLVSGRLISGLGVGLFMLIGTGVRVLGLAGVGLAGLGGAAFWGLTLLIYAGVGVGASAIDTGFNNYVSANYSAGRLSWLHACFGLGATLGPLLMSTILNNGGVWQTGYLIVGGLHAILLVALLLTRHAWRFNAEDDPDQAAVAAASPWQTLRIPAVLLAILVFFLYTGLEITVGNFAYTLFTQARGIDEATAATWTSLYWASLTAGRFIIGIVMVRVGEVRILRWSMIGIVLGAVLLSIPTVPVAGFAGLLVTGFAMAAIFPTLIALTPGRFGLGHAPNAIGFQIGAAGIGYAVLPGLTGRLATTLGLEVIGPVVAICGLAMWGLYELGIRLAPPDHARA